MMQAMKRPKSMCKWLPSETLGCLRSKLIREDSFRFFWNISEIGGRHLSKLNLMASWCFRGGQEGGFSTAHSRKGKQEFRNTTSHQPPCLSPFEVLLDIVGCVFPFGSDELEIYSLPLRVIIFRDVLLYDG